MQLSYHGINGHSPPIIRSPESPTWNGIENIRTALQSTHLLIDLFITEYPSAFIKHSMITSDSKTFEDNILLKEGSLGLSTIQSPNPSSTSILHPLFLQYYSPSTIASTSLYKILNEYLINIKPSINALIQLDTAMKGITTLSIQLKNELNRISDQLATLSPIFEGIDTSMANNMLNAHMTGEIIIIIYTIAMVIILTIAIIVLICISVFKWKKVLSLRFSLHVLWNIKLFFIAIGLVICGLLGIFNILSHDIIVTINYMLSKEYMDSKESIFVTIPKEYKGFMEICLNENGDLTTLLKVDKELFNLLDLFYRNAYEVERLHNEIKEVMESKVIIGENNIYDKYLNDIASTTDSSYGIDDIAFCLKELNIWTDSGLSNTVQPGCSTRTYDNWVPNLHQCPSNYIYSTNGINPKNCLLINNWTKPLITIRYNAACDASGIPITTGAHKYFDPIFDYYTNCGILLDSIITSNNDFDMKYTTLLSNIKEEYDDIKELIEAIRKVYNPLINNDMSLYDIINCGSLKEDALQFYNNIRKRFNPLCTCSVVISLISCLGAYAACFFYIDVLYRYEQIIIDNDDKKEEEKKEDNKVQDEISEGTPEYNPSDSNKDKKEGEDLFEENPMYSILFRAGIQQSEINNIGNPSEGPGYSNYEKKKMMPIKKIQVSNNNLIETASNLKESHRIELTKD